MGKGGKDSVSVQSEEMKANGEGLKHGKKSSSGGGYFQMPLHYPRYTKGDYQTMPEWKLDCLLAEYGLPVTGNLDHKRKYAMGAFLWGP